MVDIVLPRSQSERLQPGWLQPGPPGDQGECGQAVQPVVPHLRPQEKPAARGSRENRDHQITRNKFAESNTRLLLGELKVIMMMRIEDTHNVRRKGQEGSVFASAKPTVQ